MEAAADGVPEANTTVGCALSCVPSVVSVAVRVTVSDVASVSAKATWPFDPVTAGEGEDAPTTALPVDERLTDFPATGLFVEESSVTTTDVPIEPYD